MGDTLRKIIKVAVSFWVAGNSSGDSSGDYFPPAEGCVSNETFSDEITGNNVGIPINWVIGHNLKMH